MQTSDKWVYITTPYMGYLSAIHQHGPIVHPAKVKYSEAVQLMIAGAQITIHDPNTKMTYPLTLGNIGQTPEKTVMKNPDPIAPVKLHGASDIGKIPNRKPVVNETPTAKAEEPVKIESTTVAIDEPVVTEEAAEVVTKIEVKDLIEMLQNGTVTEDDVKWADYTKSERRQIRNTLNNMKPVDDSTTTE